MLPRVVQETCFLGIGHGINKLVDYSTISTDKQYRLKFKIKILNGGGERNLIRTKNKPWHQFVIDISDEKKVLTRPLPKHEVASTVHHLPCNHYCSIMSS